jgi:hypothetical protein
MTEESLSPYAQNDLGSFAERRVGLFSKVKRSDGAFACGTCCQPLLSLSTYTLITCLHPSAPQALPMNLST